MSLEQDAARGKRAREILDDPVFKEAIKGVRDSLHEKWEQSPMRDAEGRETIRSVLEGVKLLEKCLAVYADSGRISAETLEMERRKRTTAPTTKPA